MAKARSFYMIDMDWQLVQAAAIQNGQNTSEWISCSLV